MDQDCIHFLQWALPRLDMRWKGFRKVRRQVCKRIRKRQQALGLQNWQDYRQYLESHYGEWDVLDGFCRITISRFYRDFLLFDYLGEVVFPVLMDSFSGIDRLNGISLGCASGEEPYTLAIMWQELVAAKFQMKRFHITAVDMDGHLLQRAKEAKYETSSLRELPELWIDKAFIKDHSRVILKDAYKDLVEFIEADIRSVKLGGPYHLVCCRYLVATYFSEPLQVQIFSKIRRAMPKGGVLVLGSHEKVPDEVKGFVQDKNVPQVYWAD